MPRARILLKALILSLAGASAAAAVAAQGGRFSGHLDVFSHFAPQYLGVGVLALIIAFVLESGRDRTLLAVFGGVAVLGSLALITPELMRPAAPRAPADAPDQLKLIQFNVAEMNTDLEPALDWLAAQDPDVLVTQESSPAFRRAVQARMGRHMTCGMTCGVTIFSRAAPVRVEKPRRGYYGLGPAIAVVHFAGDGREFAVVGLHYGWPTEVRTHKENSRRMIQVLKGRPRDRLVVAGDFNSTPWSFARRRDDAALGIERRTRALFSWPARGLPGLAVLPIDHVYAGPDWRTVSVDRGPRLGSDHYPVVAILAPTR